MVSVTDFKRFGWKAKITLTKAVLESFLVVVFEHVHVHFEHVVVFCEKWLYLNIRIFKETSEITFENLGNFSRHLSQFYSSYYTFAVHSNFALILKLRILQSFITVWSYEAELVIPVSS